MTDCPARRPSLVYGVWAILAAAVVAAGLHYLWLVRGAEREASFVRVEVAAELIEQALMRNADGIGAVMDFVETRMAVAQDGAVEAAAALDGRLRTMIEEQRFGVVGILSLTPQGVVGWSPSGEMVGTSISDREIVARLNQPDAPRITVSAPFISRTSGRWILAAGRAIRDGDGKLVRMIVVGVDPMHLSGLLATIAHRPERLLVVRQLSDGQVRAASHDTQARLAQGPVPDHPVVQAARQAQSGRIEFQQATSGRPVIAAFRALPSRDRVVYAAFDREAEMTNFWRTARTVLAAVFIYVLSSLLMAVAWDRNARLQRRLHEMATIDPLTGLHNRRALGEWMRRLRSAPTHTGKGFACLLFDIDHFKSINDRFGHAQGDEVLCEVAALLRSEVRSADIVCRWGGEEMLVVLRDCNRQQGMARAEALRLAIEQMYAQGQHPVDRVTVSVGVACFPTDAGDPEAITDLADRALYSAKHRGRNRVEAAEPALAA